MTRIDQINQMMRSFCLVVLLLTFCFVFIYGVMTKTMVVGADAFAGVLGVVITWFFKARDEQAAKNPPANGGST